MDNFFYWIQFYFFKKNLKFQFYFSRKLMHSDDNSRECIVLRQLNPFMLGTLTFLKKSDNEEENAKYLEERKDEILHHIEELERDREEKVRCLENYREQMTNADSIESFRKSEIKYVYLEKCIKRLEERAMKLSNELSDVIEKSDVCIS